MARYASPISAPNRLPPTPDAPRAERSALADAIISTSENVQRLRLAIRADPDDVFLPMPGMPHGPSALGLAIQSGRSVTFLRELIQAGAPVDREDAVGRSPLQAVLNTQPRRDIRSIESIPEYWRFGEAPYDRAHQALLVRQAVALLAAGAAVPTGPVVAAPGNEASARCVHEYRDALLAEALRCGMRSGQLRAHWGIVAAFLHTRA